MGTAGGPSVSVLDSWQREGRGGGGGRQTDRQTEREGGSRRERGRDGVRERERETHTQRERGRDRQTDRQTDRHRQTDTDRWLKVGGIGDRRQ